MAVIVYPAYERLFAGTYHQVNYANDVSVKPLMVSLKPNDVSIKLLMVSIKPLMVSSLFLTIFTKLIKTYFC